MVQQLLVAYQGNGVGLALRRRRGSGGGLHRLHRQGQFVTRKGDHATVQPVLRIPYEYACHKLLLRQAGLHLEAGHIGLQHHLIVIVAAAEILRRHLIGIAIRIKPTIREQAQVFQ